MTVEQVLTSVVIQDRRPHSSSVTAYGGDSFPPGEAIGVLPHHSNHLSFLVVGPGGAVTKFWLGHNME